MIVYHGTNEYFEEFDPDRLCSKGSIDQYGSGFYFYKEPAATCRYGDIVVVAKIPQRIFIRYSKIDRYRLVTDIVEYILLKSPELERRILDFYDIGEVPFNKAVRQVAVIYSKAGNILEQMNALGNDFFPGKDTQILLEEVCKLTGYTGIYVEESGIYVVWKKSKIQIVKHTTLEEMP